MECRVVNFEFTGCMGVRTKFTTWQFFLLFSYRSNEINKLTMDRYLLKSVLSFIHSPNGFHNVEDLNIWYCYKCEWIVSSTISSDILEDTEKTEMREFFRQFKLAEMCRQKKYVSKSISVKGRN